MKIGKLKMGQEFFVFDFEFRPHDKSRYWLHVKVDRHKVLIKERQADG